MCGIWGIVDKTRLSVPPARLQERAQKFAQKHAPAQNAQNQQDHTLPQVPSQFLRMMHIQQNRGKDGFGVAGWSQNTRIDSDRLVSHAKTIEQLSGKVPDVPVLIGHTLHAVVSLVPQPVRDESTILAANCEIYNWQSIALHENISPQNDTQVLHHLLRTKDPKNALKQLNGVYACAFLDARDAKNPRLVLARDLIGEKPLFYADTPHRFYFASESKTLRDILGEESYLITELNPRHIITVDLRNGSLKHTQRAFYAKSKEMPADEANIVPKLSQMLLDCVKARLPDPSVKIGVLFSGGVDSTLIALILKQLGREFVCYTAAFEDEGQGKSQDLALAQQAAAEYGFNLNSTICTLKDTEQLIKEVIPLIESSNVVKVGVALPFYVCCKEAAKNNVRVIFSGLGSEELFAGYQRHKSAADINLECISGLRKMYERDLYRDDVVTMNNTVELRLPFLDDELIRYALRIPASLKIKDDQGKYILRQAALALGLSKTYALRPKQAAQYGSRFDKAIQKLASKAGFELKSAYLNTFFEPRNQRLAVLFSSGKDSMYALYTMHRQAYPISCLITLKSKNADSYMFHTPAIELASLQARSLGIPLITQETAGEKEEELADLRSAIKKALKKYHIDGIVSGALYSVYQRERIETIAEELGIKVFSPLWHIDQEKELRQIIDSGFSIVLTQTAAEGLDGGWLGRPLAHADVDRLVQLNKKLGINIAGEGGEFESLVLDCPLFAKRLVLSDTSVQRDGGKYTLSVGAAKLIPK